MNLEFSSELELVIRACEKLCVAECCGLDAFDIVPVHIASHLSYGTGCVEQSRVDSLIREIDQIHEMIRELLVSNSECEFTSVFMNQVFSAPELSSFFSELRLAIVAAPDVYDYSNKKIGLDGDA